MPDASRFALHPAFPRPRVLPLRQRSEVIHRVLKRRLETVLPAAMRESGFDMWLVICQEDNWDPIHDTFCPMDPWRPILQMLVFFDRGRQQRRRADQPVDDQHARALRHALARQESCRAMGHAAANRRRARPAANRHQHRPHPMGRRRIDPQPLSPTRGNAPAAVRRTARFGRADGRPLGKRAFGRGDRTLRARGRRGEEPDRRNVQPRGDRARRNDARRSGLALLAAVAAIWGCRCRSDHSSIVIAATPPRVDSGRTIPCFAPAISCVATWAFAICGFAAIISNGSICCGRAKATRRRSPASFWPRPIGCKTYSWASFAPV